MLDGVFPGGFQKRLKARNLCIEHRIELLRRLIQNEPVLEHAGAVNDGREGAVGRSGGFQDVRKRLCLPHIHRIIVDSGARGPNGIQG